MPIDIGGYIANQQITAGLAQQGIVTRGLILNLDAGRVDSYNGGYYTSWLDVSGQNNNGTLTNYPVYTSSTPGYFTFDGTNDYVNFSSTIFGVATLSTISELTINTWVYVSAFPVSGHAEIVSWWSSVPETYTDGFLGFTSLTGGFNNTNPGIRFGDGWANTGVSFTASTDINKWWNITAVKTSSNAYIYLNQSLVATKGSSLSWGFNNNLAIGRQHEAAEYFNGRIGTIQMYNRALTAQEVAQNFNSTRSRFGV